MLQGRGGGGYKNTKPNKQTTYLLHISAVTAGSLSIGHLGRCTAATGFLLYQRQTQDSGRWRRCFHCFLSQACLQLADFSVDFSQQFVQLPLGHRCALMGKKETK